jgi:hypothetical protein
MSRFTLITVLGLVFLLSSFGCVGTEGIIRLNTDPPGAKYFVDGIEKGTTPAEFLWSWDRPILIELKKEGYYTEEELLNKGWLHYQMSQGNYGKVRTGKVSKQWTVSINRKLKAAPKRGTGEGEAQ